MTHRINTCSGVTVVGSRRVKSPYVRQVATLLADADLRLQWRSGPVFMFKNTVAIAKTALFGS